MHSDFYDYAGNPKRPLFTTHTLDTLYMYIPICNGYIEKRVCGKLKRVPPYTRTHVRWADFNAPRGLHTYISPSGWIYGRGKSYLLLHVCECACAYIYIHIYVRDNSNCR